MPIGKFTVPLENTLFYRNTLVPIGETWAAGRAVAVVNLAPEVYEFRSCGALAVNHTMQFVGFTKAPATGGEAVIILVGRGDRIIPQVEGAVPLVSGESVFLALTPGMVTQTPPNVTLNPSATILRVGFAISTTEMLFNTDAVITGPG